MNSRQDFLEGLFRSLDAKAVPYCILRNYDNLFADDTSDVDLIVERHDLDRFKECLRAAAADAGQRFVHRARYVNYSYVFWNAWTGFIRIDFETELRWRVFPILSARSIIEARQARDGFYVPHPRHESVILFLQAVWRGTLGDRYKRQLARLYDAYADKEELRSAFREAFGAVGNELADLHSRIAAAEFSKALRGRLIRSIAVNSLTRSPRLRCFAANMREDLLRFWERLRRPPGISLLCASSASDGKYFGHLMRKLEFLFPSQKFVVETINLSAGRLLPPGWELGLKVRRIWTLFKGGFFVRNYRIANNVDLRRVARTHPRLLYPSRAFFCLEDSAQRACLGHVGTGLMTDFVPDETTSDAEFSACLIEFISVVLEKERLPRNAQHRQRGVMAVLIGLDGSGKTTLARNLARLAAVDGRFDGVRYFHWRPKVFRSVEFPLPEFHETPRKQPQPKSWLRSLFSAIRLVKNVILANLAHFFRVRPLLRRNHLVVIDRFFYNYRLDPDSVKYSGPKWLLEALLPWFPRPDVVITLDANAETLLSRKRELSPEQITRQIAVMRQLDFKGVPSFQVDAGQTASRVAEATFGGIVRSQEKDMVQVAHVQVS